MSYAKRLEALIEAGVARPGRVGVTGTSYGGYSAWWATTHFPRSRRGLLRDPAGPPALQRGDDGRLPRRGARALPGTLASQLRPRLLIVQGLKDPNVTADNIRVVTSALDESGVPYELLTFEDEGHGIARPENLKVLYPRLAEFFEEAFQDTVPSYRRSRG